RSPRRRPRCRRVGVLAGDEEEVGQGLPRREILPVLEHDRAMPEQRPQLRVIAGPNGSGKTTFVRDFLPRYVSIPHFVNADLIAAGLAPFAPETAALRAGRLVIEEIRRLAAERANFAFETTLSGRSYVPMLREFKDQGYEVFLYFLWLLDVAMMLQRVSRRVQQG